MPGAEGIERLEAHLHGQAFSPHRHDTYAIGITLSGVQTFRFRGEQWHCLQGQGHILHPDEVHDGGTRTEEGFRYRIAYIDPVLVQESLGGMPLPFVAHPVVPASHLLECHACQVWDMGEEIDDISRIELVLSVVSLLLGASYGAGRKSGPLALNRLMRVRDLIAASPARSRAMDELERLADLDRWTLARQFRAAFGTSPSRFRTLRRLDLARRSIMRGAGLAEAALEAGFADQSHMSRHFKHTYGLTPAKWAGSLV